MAGAPQPTNPHVAQRTRYLAMAAAIATGIFVGPTIVATRFVIGQISLRTSRY